jgi:hypothetical protein
MLKASKALAGRIMISKPETRQPIIAVIGATGTGKSKVRPHEQLQTRKGPCC